MAIKRGSGSGEVEEPGGKAGRGENLSREEAGASFPKVLGSESCLVAWFFQAMMWLFELKFLFLIMGKMVWFWTD